MLPRSKRLNKSDFKIKTGKKTTLFGRFLSISLIKGSSDKGGRVAIVVPGALSKNKPLRNTLKRRLYTIIGAHLKTLPGSNIIIYPKKEALKQGTVVLKEDLESVLKNIRL